MPRTSAVVTLPPLVVPRDLPRDLPRALPRALPRGHASGTSSELPPISRAVPRCPVAPTPEISSAGHKRSPPIEWLQKPFCTTSDVSRHVLEAVKEHIGVM
ncbi:unnamed protein product [Lampetra fluviatilis]